MKIEGIKRIADYANRSERTIWEWITKRGFPATLVGGVYVAETEEIDSWGRAETPMTFGELHVILVQIKAEIAELRRVSGKK